MTGDLVAGLNRSGRGPLMEKMGLEWIEATPGRLQARIPASGNEQPYGFVHGGASAALAETLASAGAWLSDTSLAPMGVELKVNHLRPVSQGWVTGTAVPLKKGRTFQVWEIRITDDAGSLTAFATCTVTTRSTEGTDRKEG